MRLSRIIVNNFRNFKSLDVKLGDHVVRGTLSHNAYIERFQ
jgi:predicted ATP-binding protein involved in virulence